MRNYYLIGEDQSLIKDKEGRWEFQSRAYAQFLRDSIKGSKIFSFSGPARLKERFPDLEIPKSV